MQPCKEDGDAGKINLRLFLLGIAFVYKTTSFCPWVRKRKISFHRPTPLIRRWPTFFSFLTNRPQFCYYYRCTLKLTILLFRHIIINVTFFSIFTCYCHRNASLVVVQYSQALLLNRTHVYAARFSIGYFSVAVRSLDLCSAGGNILTLRGK